MAASSGLQEELERLREAAAAEIAAAESVDALEAIRVRYLGRKGSLNAVQRAGVISVSIRRAEPAEAFTKGRPFRSCGVARGARGRRSGPVA